MWAAFSAASNIPFPQLMHKLHNKIVFPSTNPVGESDPFDIKHTISTKSKIKIQQGLIGYDPHKSEKLTWCWMINVHPVHHQQS